MEKALWLDALCWLVRLLKMWFRSCLWNSGSEIGELKGERTAARKMTDVIPLPRYILRFLIAVRLGCFFISSFLARGFRRASSPDSTGALPAAPGSGWFAAAQLLHSLYQHLCNGLRQEYLSGAGGSFGLFQNQNCFVRFGSVGKDTEHPQNGESGN